MQRCLPRRLRISPRELPVLIFAFDGLMLGWRFSLLYHLPSWLSDIWISNLYGADKVVPKEI